MPNGQERKKKTESMWRMWRG